MVVACALLGGIYLEHNHRQTLEIARELTQLGQEAAGQNCLNPRQARCTVRLHPSTLYM